MGRPLNKRNFGTPTAGGSELKVNFHNGSAVKEGYIVKQKATKKFVVEEIGTGGEFTCTLATGKLPAALVAGEMSISALGSDAETYNVAKISAKRVTLANPSATGSNALGGLSQAWQMGAAASAGVVRLEEAGDDNTLVGTDDDDFTEDA
jgi:ribosomal protein L27